MKRRNRMFPDKPLGKPVKRYADTFSAQSVILEAFYPEVTPDQIKAIEDIVAPEFATGDWVAVEDENTAQPTPAMME